MSKERSGQVFSLRKLPFWGIVGIILILGIATFIEKEYGSNFVYNQIYSSWWFSFLWAVLVSLTMIGMVKGKLYKNLSLFFVHLSFIVILAGALCTKLFAEQGYIIANKEKPTAFMQMDEGQKALPFEVKLDTFYIAYYPGTNAPADYISQISLKNTIDGKAISGKVSMNNIFSYGGYRFYQSSFENDWNTSILSINRDIWGIPITYTGYALFALSMIWFLFSPQNTFRKLLSHPLLKKLSIIFLLFFPLSAFSQTLTKDSLSVNTMQAEEFSRLWMLYDCRIIPVATFAHDFTLKLVGKSSFSYLNANQFLMGLLFFPDKWEHVALFEVKDTELKKELNAEKEKAALADFFDKEGNYKLSKYWKDLGSNAPKSPQLKEVEKLNDKVQLINMLHGGSLLQIYPIETDGIVKWHYPTQNLRKEEQQKNLQFIRTSLLSYYQALLKGEEKEALSMLDEIKSYQQKNAVNILPSETHLNVELFYLKSDLTSWLFKANMFLGILSLLTVFVLSEKKVNTINKIFYALLILCFIVQTLSIGLRTYIGGRLPFSNGFETMLIIAWCAMLIALLFKHKMPIIMPFGFLLSGCTLLVAHLGMMNPQITPLVPVLSSPLLSIHVSVIMLAYTLLAFVMLNSLTSILQLIFSKKYKEQYTLQLLERNKIYNLICLYPCLLLLGAGIFIGAVWANISWGRYWGWDPKEVWALITFLIYSLVLHEKNIKLFSDVFFFHAFGFLAFSSVLMTYFGVNYFLGGMHSYAGEGQFDSAFTIVLATTILSLVIVIIGYFKYKRFRKIIE